MTAKRIDGNVLAHAVESTLEITGGKRPTLGIFVVGHDPVVEHFVERKVERARELGVGTERYSFEYDVATENLVEAIEQSPHDGIIVQLPLPEHVDTEAILNAIPLKKDIDVLSDAGIEAFENNTHVFTPPVAAAILHILETEDISLKGKNVAIVGRGKLVGTPTRTLIERKGAIVDVVARDTQKEKRAEVLLQADIIISGAGSPGLIQPEDIAKGAVVIDAGTSGSGNTLVGDVAPECVKKASVVALSPGGVGPLTVAMLFKNLFLTQ